MEISVHVDNSFLDSITRGDNYCYVLIYNPIKSREIISFHYVLIKVISCEDCLHLKFTHTVYKKIRRFGTHTKFTCIEKGEDRHIHEPPYGGEVV